MTNTSRVAAVCGTLSYKGPILRERLDAMAEKSPFDLILVETSAAGAAAITRAWCRVTGTNYTLFKEDPGEMVAYASRLKDAGHDVTAIAVGGGPKLNQFKSKAKLFGLELVTVTY